MTKLHCIISMEKDLIVQGISILGSMDYRPNTLGTTTLCSGYHDIMLVEPSEGTLLNVHIMKDKP